jgi:hypothetical protein
MKLIPCAEPIGEFLCKVAGLLDALLSENRRASATACHGKQPQFSVARAATEF